MMKRMALSLMAVAVISLVVTAASFALFTATTTNSNNTFASGTVDLGGLSGCGNTFNNIAPGDSGTFTCSVTYTGSLNAWLGLTTTYTGNLTSCDGANSLQAVIGGGYLNNAPNQVVGSTPQVTGYTANFVVNWNLPLLAGNTCQNKTASLTLQVKAVQAANNTMAPPAVGPISWN